MKQITILTLVVASLATSFVHAETPTEHEYKQLKEQRIKAIAAANDPINRRYQASLEQLLRRATQTNDLDTAIKIREELKAFSPATPVTSQTATGAELKAYLAATNWGWYDKVGKDWVRDHTLTLNEDGTASVDKRECRYEIIKHDSFRLTETKGTLNKVFIVNVKKNEGLEATGSQRIAKE